MDLFVSRERSSIANRRRFPLKVFNHLVFLKYIILSVSLSLYIDISYRVSFINAYF